MVKSFEHNQSGFLYLNEYSYYISDVLKEGIWTETLIHHDSSLDALIPDMLELVLSSSADSTVRKYSQGWRRWSEWAKSKIGVPTIPAQPLSVALYPTCLVNKAVEQNQSVGPIETAAYSHIRWGHPMAGLPYPTDHSTVMAVLEAAKRKLAKPVPTKRTIDRSSIEDYLRTLQYELCFLRSYSFFVCFDNRILGSFSH